MDSVINLVKDYEIIGLGEATHGNYKNTKFRVNVIKKLIEDHNIREVFFEADVFRVKTLNNSGKNLSSRMNKMTWIFDNKPTKELCEFINNTPNVKVYGIDAQSYDTENDISDDSELGKIYRKWGKYMIPDPKKRFKAMYKLFEAQHTEGVKAVIICHNFHLNKLAKNEGMGHYINKSFKDKYICIANTFTNGTYHGLHISNTAREFQDVDISIKESLYNNELVLYSPPPTYIYEGSAQVDKENPRQYFIRESSKGWDAVIFIDDETPLIPYSSNQGVQYFKKLQKI